MVQLRRILCPIAFSQLSRRAFDHATALARLHIAEITCLHAAPVVTVGWQPADLGLGLANPDPTPELAAQLVSFVQPALGRGINVDTVVVSGEPAGSIVAPAAARQDPPALFEDWARGRQVFWEVWPLRQLCRGRIIQTGWTVELSARCPQPREATRLADRLLSIARGALPADHAEVAFRVLPYDGSFRTGPKTAWIPEVRITIEVARRSGCFDPADEAEWDAVRKIELRLRAVGLQKRR